MTKRQFYLSILALLVVCLICGPTSYFVYQAQVNYRAKQVEIEKEKTTRTEYRWGTLDRVIDKIKD